MEKLIETNCSQKSEVEILKAKLLHLDHQKSLLEFETDELKDKLENVQELLSEKENVLLQHSIHLDSAVKLVIQQNNERDFAKPIDPAKMCARCFNDFNKNPENTRESNNRDFVDITESEDSGHPKHNREICNYLLA